MAYCQSLVKLRKGFPLGVCILEDSNFVLVFSCFKSCSISPHLLPIAALGYMVCWPGCISKCGNASQKVLLRARQCSWGCPVSLETMEMGQLLSAYCRVGSSLLFFSPPWGITLLLSVPHPLGWMQTVTGAFYSLAVSVFATRLLQLQSVQDQVPCVHTVKLRGWVSFTFKI